MDEQKLNRKLAGWAGFKEEFEVDTGVGFWVYPDGKGHNDLPNFTQSLDACFEWLVPKLRELKYYTILRDISKAFHCSLVYTTTAKPSRYGEADAAALALCLAIEKLID